MDTNDNVYTVIAYRFGDYESHSYLVGVFSTPDLANSAVISEEDWRGGKYSCIIIIKSKLNQPKRTNSPFTMIKSL